MFSSFFSSTPDRKQASLTLSRLEASPEFKKVNSILDRLKAKEIELSKIVDNIEKNKEDNETSLVTKKKYSAISLLRMHINNLIRIFNQHPRPSTEDQCEEVFLARNLLFTIIKITNEHAAALATPRSHKKEMVCTFLPWAVIFGTAVAASTASFSWPLILLAVLFADQACQLGFHATGINNYLPETVLILMELIEALMEIIKNSPQALKQTLPNYYDILELPFGAPIREVLLAFRRLARNYHPDRHMDKELNDERVIELTNKFIAIKEACKILSDPQSKALYDLAHGVGHNNTLKRLTYQ